MLEFFHLDRIEQYVTPYYAVLLTQEREVYCAEIRESPEWVWSRINSGSVVALLCTNIRMALEWHEDAQGILGLCAMGPTENCRVSKAVEKGVISNVTNLFLVTEVAMLAWNKEPWRQDTT